jgi:hypothetical protein
VNFEVQPAEVRLRDLSADDRQRALTLAWGRVAPVQLSPISWGIPAIAVAFGACAIALGPYASERGPRVGIAMIASVVPPVVALVRHQFVANPYFEKLGLRAAGVKFVLQHKDAWTKLTARQVGEATMSRFRQSDPKKEWYTFWLPQADSQYSSDMPPRYTNFMGLAVGEFVGVRAGPYLDLRETAQKQAAAQDPDHVAMGTIVMGEDAKLQMEREAHYRDVVNIDYKRTDELSDGTAAGIFALGLTNGVVIDFATVEAGPPVMAAIEHIRDRTRKAKARA